MQAVDASEIAERAETHTTAPSRGAKCSFTSPQQPPRPSRRLTSGTPFGHPKSLKIAVVSQCAQRCVRERPKNAKKRTFGGPRVPKGAKMEPKLRKICTQNVQKKRGFAKKCEMWFGPIIYYIFSLLAPCKNLTFSHL